MNKTNIYHGSERIIEKPIYGYGKTYNDYGVGFYCTESIDVAKEWGVSYEKDGYANGYIIDLDGLEILDLNDDKYCILHWLALLLKHREFSIQTVLAHEAKGYLLNHFLVECDGYDIVKGYRADDSFFLFAQDFINGTISYRQLNNAMNLGKLGQQIVLKSERAFEAIEYIRYEVVNHNEWYAKKMLRDKKARSDYFDVEKNKRRKDDIYVHQILDEEMKSNDIRLR